VKPTRIITRSSTDFYASDDKQIVAALRFIHQNTERNLKVEEVLQHVPLSRRTLEKRFLLITGTPVYKYIFNLRMERFVEKLVETELTVTQIAQELGLDDTKNIARQFKLVKGMSPRAYRNKYARR
jgi:LacI family transcriptional regulator